MTQAGIPCYRCGGSMMIQEQYDLEVSGDKVLVCVQCGRASDTLPEGTVLPGWAMAKPYRRFRPLDNS